MTLHDQIRELYQSGLSMRKLSARGFKKRDILTSLKGVTKTISDAVKLAHKLNPEKYKHSEETKEKMRKSRAKYLASDESAFVRRQKGKMSYGEAWLHDLFVTNNVYCKYDVVNEYCEYPYFIDFAFVNEKIAVEFDGICHLKKNRQKHDKKRDAYLENKGWRIFRISSLEMNKFNIAELLQFIGLPDQKRLHNGLALYAEIKRQKIKKKEKKLKELKEKRKSDRDKFIANRRKNVLQLKNIEALSKLWCVSTKHVRRFIRRNMSDLVPIVQLDRTLDSGSRG